jgi:hypothetical protein
MGADFIFNRVIIKKGKEEITKKKMLKAIEKFKIPELVNDTKLQIVLSLNKDFSNELSEFNEYWEMGRLKETDEKGRPLYAGTDPKDKNNGKRLTLEQARSDMKELVEEFFNSLEYRDVGCFEHKGDTIYITGGMSWGDMPTDSTTTFNGMMYLPQKILKAGGLK